LDAAIKEAASLSKTKKYSTQNFPEYEKDMNDIFNSFPFAKSKESFIKEELGEETFRLMEQIKKVQTRKGIQAIMPFEITIQ
jgi:protease IV